MESPRLTAGPLFYGGDYNPEQWLKEPQVLQDDLRLMTLSHTTAVSMGIFSWVSIEPEEGRFEFGWLDERMDSLHKNGQKVVLATPSGAKPNWMAWKYEEIRRVDRDGRREPQGGRHNHCMTSPIYRAKVAEMNERLAERYKDHPALAMWHLSNEYGGYCHCDLCMAAFQEWLKARYGTLEALNDAWWTRFWSRTFTDWSQIRSIDGSSNGLALDWRRFMTHQVADFIRHERTPIRKLTPNTPVTANFMAFFQDYDYHILAKELDLVTWDAYPQWHTAPDDQETARWTAFQHEMFAGMKPDRPWLLMECTPSVTNWQAACRPKRPGVHTLSVLQAVAHGSEGAMHFQFRKSLGSCEQHHGAFVDHTGNEHNRVFREVAAAGDAVAKVGKVAGVVEPADVAVLFDWQNWWAIDHAFGPRNADKDYPETCIRWHKPLWEAGITTDVISAEHDLAKYKLVIAPMLYMIPDERAARIRSYVEGGGTIICTYLTGWVNESTNCHRTGFPGNLRDVFGIWAEEMDVLNEFSPQAVKAEASLGLKGTYAVRHFAEVIHAEGAEVAAHYTNDYYASEPAVTVNRYGKGRAIFVAARTEDALMTDLVGHLVSTLGIESSPVSTSAGVSVQKRGSCLFLLNFTPNPAEAGLDRAYVDALTGVRHEGEIKIPAYGSMVLEPA